MKRLALLILLIAAPAAAQEYLNDTTKLPTLLFPADNWWNLDVSAAPVDANSATILATVGHKKINFVAGRDHVGAFYGIPWAVITGSITTENADWILYSSESEDVDFPLPTTALTTIGWVEGLDTELDTIPWSGDRHMLVYNKDADYLYEFYQPYSNTSGSTKDWFKEDTHHDVAPGEFVSATESVWNAATNNVRTDGWTSSDAAGLQVLPGLLRIGEIEGSGPINHALRVALRWAGTPNGSNYVWPATHGNSNTAVGWPFFGTRFRLKSSVDISGYSAAAQKILQALKTYGLIFADTGVADVTAFDLIGDADVRWGGWSGPNQFIAGLLAELQPDIFMDDDFQVIELGWSPTLNITTTTLVNATQDAAYSQIVRGTGGRNNYTWTIPSGSLPTGMTLTSTGTWMLISGTPTGTGTSNFTAHVVDAQGTPATDDQALSITVDAAQGPPDLLALVVDAGSTFASFTVGVSRLDYSAECAVVIKNGVGTTIETITSSEGLAIRRLQTTVALSAATSYTAEQDCVGADIDTTLYSFTTKATPTGGDRTVAIQSGAAATLTGVARATVRYDDNAALSSPATVPNTNCASGCTISLTLAAGRWYYRWEWQDAADAVLGVGTVQPLLVQ